MFYLSPSNEYIHYIHNHNDPDTREKASITACSLSSSFSINILLLNSLSAFISHDSLNNHENQVLNSLITNMNIKAFTPSNTQVTLAETGDQVISGWGMYQLVACVHWNSEFVLSIWIIRLRIQPGNFSVTEQYLVFWLSLHLLSAWWKSVYTITDSQHRHSSCWPHYRFLPCLWYTTFIQSNINFSQSLSMWSMQ